MYEALKMANDTFRLDDPSRITFSARLADGDYVERIPKDEWQALAPQMDLLCVYDNPQASPRGKQAQKTPSKGSKGFIPTSPSHVASPSHHKRSQNFEILITTPSKASTSKPTAEVATPSPRKRQQQVEVLLTPRTRGSVSTPTSTLVESPSPHKRQKNSETHSTPRASSSSSSEIAPPSRVKSSAENGRFIVSIRLSSESRAKKFNIRPSANLEKLFEVFSKSCKVPKDDLRFYLDDTRLHGTETAETAGLEAGAVVTATTLIRVGVDGIDDAGIKFYNVARSRPLSKLMDVVGKHVGLPTSEFRLKYGRVVIKPHHTLDGLKVQNKDVITFIAL